MAEQDRGSASVIALGICATLTAVTVTIVSTVAVIPERQNLQHAADASALAAAETALGAVAGVPCTRAEQLAQLYSVTVSSCECDGGAICTVVVGHHSWLGSLTEMARAGPD